MEDPKSDAEQMELASAISRKHSLSLLASQSGSSGAIPTRRDSLVLNLLEDFHNLQRKVEPVVPDYSTHDEVSFPGDQKFWYKEAVFYEVYVRAFCDSNGDGHGDLVGLTSKLDYLHSLGVDCLWLLPIYPSPLKDDGYDVADYVDIHPDYGNLGDFKTLVNAVHERSMRLIIDFVPNHSSADHKWFQMAREDPNSPYRDYYVWTDDPSKYKEARIIFIDTEASNWTWDEKAGQYYWHRFYSSQPDLNFENPKVQEEMFAIMKFWLDIGVDGFRVDAVPYLFEEEGTNCENLPKTHEFLRQMRKWLDDHYSGRVLLAEACQMPIDVRKYFGDGDEFHMGFHFPVMPRIYLSIRSEESTTLRDILADTPPIPESCQWVTFLRNHDELTLEMVTPEERQWMWAQYAPEPRMKINLGIRRRLAPLMNNDRRQIELAYNLLFTLPGSPILYYGDEIGMGDNIWLPDRNGVRTPMQWKAKEMNGGFSTASKLYAPVINCETYGYNAVNVDSQYNEPGSLFHAVSHMVRMRKKHPSFGTGALYWIDCDDKAVATYIRSTSFDKMLCVSNLSSRARDVTIKLPSNIISAPAADLSNEGLMFPDILTSIKYPVVEGVLHASLAPYQFLWLNVAEAFEFTR
jgi:maltose alpha-D-glucosyltransferase/alpha-amylase